MTRRARRIPAASRRAVVSFALVCAAGLAPAGCGGHGGGGHDDNFAPVTDVHGSWARTVTVTQDDCAMTARAGAPVDGIVAVDQNGASLLATLAPSGTGGRPMAGPGTVTGNLLTIDLTGTKTESVCDFYGCVECVLSIRESDSASLQGDALDGALTVLVSSSDLVACGFAGDCEVKGTFKATRCPIAGCP